MATTSCISTTSRCHQQCLFVHIGMRLFRDHHTYTVQMYVMHNNIHIMSFLAPIAEDGWKAGDHHHRPDVVTCFLRTVRRPCVYRWRCLF